MAVTHPYISGAGNIVQVIKHLRSSFPAKVSAETIKKLGIAPKNESYVINVLRFVAVIDDDGEKTPAAKTVFSKHQDEQFEKAFSELIKISYSELFEVHGDDAWKLDKNGLITFFRSADDTGATIGSRQAATFRALAGLSGYGDVPTPGARKKVVKKKPAKRTPKKNDEVISAEREIGLTVRIEINLPADGEQKTYDRIFRSIRENLIDG